MLLADAGSASLQAANSLGGPTFDDRQRYVSYGAVFERASATSDLGLHGFAPLIHVGNDGERLYRKCRDELVTTVAFDVS
jgi:hypothetical protein